MYPTKKLQEILDKTKFTIGKIKTSDYLPSGKNPIIDQGKSLIAGYSNNDELVYNGKLPIIVYGDHTNIVKYIDFPFIGGADGIKILPFSNNYDVKYCYYLLENFKPETQGYRRHFSFFKKIDLPLPPLPIQQKIVSKLDSSFANINNQIEKLKNSISNIEELNKSVLEKVFSEGEYEMKKLGEISDIVNGGTPDTRNSLYWDGDIFWITPKDMGQIEGIYVNNTLRKITNEGLKNSSAKLSPINSLVLSSRAPIGYLAINTVPISTNQGCKTIVPNELLDTKFLYYFLSNSVKLLNDLGSGTTFKELSSSKLKEVLIPLPPLSKQKEIVKYLDQVFEKNRAIKTKYEEQIRELEELKQSLLKDAFEGRLVKE